MENIQIFQQNVQFNKNNIHGLYACIFVFTNDNRQYMLINPLKDYESNHGYLCLFLKKICDYQPTPHPNMTIKAGGEIDFVHGEETYWNLKSLNFSKGGLFDEQNPAFAENRTSIWLPQDKYQNIETANRRTLSDSYTAQGSHKLFAPPRETNYSFDQSDSKENIAASSNMITDFQAAQP